MSAIVKCKRPGRPSTINDRVIMKLEIAFGYGCNVREAIVIAGISKDSYYRLLAKNPEFRDRFKFLQEYPAMAARKNIVDAICAGDLQMSMWYLERRDPDYFKK